MKRAWMGVVALLVLGTLPLACAGKPSAELLCEKGAECGKLKEGLTEKQCVDNANQNLAMLRAVPECAPVADATEESALCASGLSCDELQVLVDDQQGTHRCSQPLKELSIGTLTDCSSALGQ